VRSFKQWLENVDTHPDADSIYPPLYTGFMNYPPQVITTWSADAITYLDPRDVSCNPYVYYGKFRPYKWKGIYGGRTATGGD
jgi:hypothetical protein